MQFLYVRLSWGSVGKCLPVVSGECVNSCRLERSASQGKPVRVYAARLAQMHERLPRNIGFSIYLRSGRKLIISPASTVCGRNEVSVP